MTRDGVVLGMQESGVLDTQESVSCPERSVLRDGDEELILGSSVFLDGDC